MLDSAKELERWGQTGAIVSLDAKRLWVGTGEPVGEGSPQARIGRLSFFLEEDEKISWQSFQQEGIFEKQDLLQKLKAFRPLPWKPSFKQASPAIFSAYWERMTCWFQANALEKAVPVISEEAPLSPNPQDILALLIPLLEDEDSSAGWIYGAWNSGGGVLGFTPELLFDLKPSSLTGMALAGSSLKPQLLQNSSKDQKEHELVVRQQKKVFQKWGTVKTSKTYEVSFKEMYHLRTDFSVSLNQEVDVSSLIHQLHPTPALGTFPHLVYQDLLPQVRHPEVCYFGAPFLFQKSPQNTLALVSIRNLEWTSEKSFLSCGCGVVKESQMDLEWQEIQMKQKHVRRIFGWKS